MSRIFGVRARFRNYMLLLAIGLNSCAPAPETPSPTSIPPQPTRAELATLADDSSLFKAGFRYSDTSGDMEVSFLDVVAFQAAVNEESDTLEIVLQMRDLPPNLTRQQTTKLIEYSWLIFVYIDPSKVSPADITEDYYLALTTTADTRFVPGREVSPTPVVVPINQLFENKGIYDSAGRPVSTPNAIANPLMDTITITGRVPGIKSDSVFSFAMHHNEDQADRPDKYVSPDSAARSMQFLKSGLRYEDASGDMELSFLDVVTFQAAVNEETNMLEVLLHMRDVPPTATHRQIRNVAEYMWSISVFLDPSKIDAADAQADYYLFVMTVETDPPSGQEIMEPAPGKPETVPINELWDAKNLNNQQGDFIPGLEAVADPDLDTITLQARIPGITSNSVFSFATRQYDNGEDTPDNFISAGPAALSTPLADVTIAQPSVSSDQGENELHLRPAGTVHAYPGPEHYAGDVLTFEIPNDGSFGDETLNVLITLDDQEQKEVSATATWNGLLLPLALDTTDLSGQHTVKFTTADARLNETYSFDVLPVDQRPANEQGAAWMARETDCCSLHYISETAAARDIDFISEHFQQAAEDFSTITGSEIDPKLNIYIMDRIWGNGGFGGNGELVISYTDRYYGPTIGGEGLETLARHEFTHAADIGLAETGDGVSFNYEGLAVYVAGGHYKPEPLAERGAALFDLGHYVPVDQFLSQHELAYLYPAAMLTYIVETYGKEKMWQFLGSDDQPGDDQPGSLEAALQSVFGVSLQNFDQAFQAWLERHEPGKQLDDLRITIELQDLRRQYQDTYSPPPNFLLAPVAEAIARPEYVPVVMREARTPANIAVELIIAHGQLAILDGDYARAEQLNKMLTEILSSGEFEDPLAKDYLDIVLATANEGYEVVNLDVLLGDHASVRVTAEPPLLINLELQKIDGKWQILP